VDLREFSHRAMQLMWTQMEARRQGSQNPVDNGPPPKWPPGLNAHDQSMDPTSAFFNSPEWGRSKLYRRLRMGPVLTKKPCLPLLVRIPALLAVGGV